MRALLLAILVAGCEGEPPEPPRVDDSSRLFEVDFPTVVEEVDDGPKHVWHADGVTLARQTVRRTYLHDRHSLSDVAAAMVRRFEAEGMEGDLVANTCQLGSRPAQCTSGWTVVDGTKFYRSGYIAEVDDELLYVELISKSEETLESQRLRLEGTFRWRI